MPTECEHGVVLDWGDFGGEDSRGDECSQCAALLAAAHAEKHRALHADFVAVIDETAHRVDADPDVLASRLVHLVVLHGLLPETEPHEHWGGTDPDGDQP